MRYLSLAEALAIAEAVTGIETPTLIQVAQLGLLDSARHALQAGFGEVEFYPPPGWGLVEAGSGIYPRLQWWACRPSGGWASS